MCVCVCVVVFVVVVDFIVVLSALLLNVRPGLALWLCG